MSFNVEFAARPMERLRPYGLRWIEEPLMPHDAEGLTQLKRAVPTIPIATGEDPKGRHTFRELVERRCVDMRIFRRHQRLASSAYGPGAVAVLRAK